MIGIFVAELDDAYQRSVWQGLVTGARSHGRGVICFSGQRLDAPDPAERARNVAYALAHPANIRGAVVLSSAIGTFQSLSNLRSLVNELGLPVVSVGLRIPDLPSVTVRGRSAMSELMRHLIRDHGCRNFALVAGPRGHLEAEEREAVFREELAAHGIPFDQGLLVRGTFVAESGAQAARELLDRGMHFDTLVCINDRMAMGAMEVLRDAGLRIPADVRVSGFDDIAEACWESPPLTTVNQPLECLGREAVDMLEELLQGRTVEDRYLDCGFVVRESCGCVPGRRFATMPPVADEDRPLLAQLRACLDEGSSERFLALLNNHLVELQAGAGPGRLERDQLGRWHAYLHDMEGDDGTIEEGHALVSNAEVRNQAAARIHDESQHLLIRDLSARLAGSFGMDLMMESLADGFEELRIQKAFLVGYQGVSPRARLLMAHCLKESGGFRSCRAGDEFDVRDLLPPGQKHALEGAIWILEPLVFQAEVLGYLLFEADGRDPRVFENLRDQVSSTLKGTQLMEQITLHEQELESEVARRTEELRRANQELLDNIETRRILEREVQEISDRTMQSIGQDLHDDLCQHLAGIGMFASVIEGQLHQPAPDPVAIAGALGRVRRLVEDAVTRTRQIARGLYPPRLAEQGLVATLEDLVESLESHGSVRITLEADIDFSWLPPAQLVQVFRILQESLHNAVKHSGSDLVMVRLYRQGFMAVAEVRDFGTGLRKNGGGGMGLGIMRYRAESMGAELVFEQLDPGLCVSCRMAWNG